MAFSENIRFTKCIENLLQGKIICHALFPELFRYLRETDENGSLTNEDKVHFFLSQIGRNLVKTSDEMGYYCTYGDYDAPQAKTDGRTFIKKSVCEFEPLIKWLRLIRSCNQDSRPVCADDIIKPSEIIHSLEESEILCKQLKEIANSFKVAANTSDVGKMLQAVLKTLVKEEYFVDASGDGLIYRATAKWSLFYDLLEFVKENEGFGRDTSERKEEHQTDLLSEVEMVQVETPDYDNMQTQDLG